MRQVFSKPDASLTRCGHLDCAVNEIALDGAPAFLRGRKAAFVSDVHVIPKTTAEDLRALAAKIGALKPDVVFLGGDYADEAADGARFFEAMAGVRAPLGAFGVLGNNDREAWPDVDALRKVMARAGCRLLVNESTEIPLGGGTLWVGGLDEFRHGAPNPVGFVPEAREGRYRVALTHFPKALSPLPELTLAGHTHGGQFNLLGITPFTIGFERLFRPRLAAARVAGLHDMGGGRLLVSKGIGASRIQLRVGVRPEIHLIHFR